MEIADIFVVNKSDRPGSDLFKANIIKMLHQRPASTWAVPVIATMATEGKGIEELAQAIEAHDHSPETNTRKPYLLAEKAYQLIQASRMTDIDKSTLLAEIQALVEKGDFNLYGYVAGKG